MTATESLELLTSKADLFRAATARVRDAAKVIATRIEEAVWEADLIGEQLPRGYRVSQVHWRGQARGTFFLLRETGRIVEHDCGESYKETFCVDGCGGLFAGDFNYEMPSPPTMSELRIFAQDLASGLLQEIAEFFQSKTEKTISVAAELESAAVLV
jgi:hypothetical protein